MIARQITPNFLIYSLSSIVDIFHFYISRPSKFNSIPPILCIMFWSVKKRLHAKDDTFKPVNIDIFLLGYNTFCSQFDTN